ncbi:hypothetical protein C2S51_025907 [Perilla frutescens var. frutescens]|nr:hypothetical protein C2S51_025907 [Perilla frutescens var. frutescens]
MAFWGVEVKPGKPVIHSCEQARGRLRISQATLGISDATKKSVVQCNVGKRSPVLLCALLPNQTESCHLDLEFAEADDVVFSVIGPRSVYLTGYYVHQSQQSSPHSDSESYGVDIQDSQTEESSYHSDDDNYEDSFIDDDEQQGFSPSPVLSSKVVDETASENDKPNNGKGQRRRLKKKCQVVESDDASSHESEDGDGYLLSVFKSKKAEKTTSTGIEANTVSQNVPTNNVKDQRDSLDNAKPKKKRKERSEQEKTSEVEINEGCSVHREDKRNEVEASKNLNIEDHQLVPPPELDSANCRKSKKKRKQLQLERTSKEEIGVKLENVAKDDNFQQGLLHPDRKKDVPSANGDREKEIHNEPAKKIKKTKKKKKNQVEEPEMGLPDKPYNQEMTPMNFENQTKIEETMQNRTLSNGLIIEEVANGPPDGKVASRGKKVKIFYTAMLKENGHIFDSNVGKRPYKFHLGNKEVIDGWNLGIEGMHVGGKRRLTVPPSMGYGKNGTGENVPPNSWLVEIILRSSEVAVLGAIFHFSGATPNYLGVQKNPAGLALCPATKNCVSTSENTSDLAHYAPPWNYNPKEGRGSQKPVSRHQAMEELLQVIQSTKPDNFTPKITEKKDDYVRVEYESPILGFVDDVEFWFPPGKKTVVQYRSASRLGSFDFDINRKRIKALRVALEKKGWASENSF